MRLLFAIFIIIPIFEMWLLIEVGGVIGALPTIGFVALTAIIGAALLKQQGLDTLTRAQSRINAGGVPATEILEGMLLAVGGALLLTPGFFTDAVGFCCLIPFLRKRIVSQLLKRGMMTVVSSSAQSYGAAYGESSQRSGSDRHRESDAGVVIEGEYKKEE